METHTDNAATATPLSFSDKLVNIFSAPGELFDNVRDTPQSAVNWVLPLVIFIILSIGVTQVVVRNPELANQLGTTIKKSMGKSVTDGKMTQEQADQAYEGYAKPGSMMFTITTVVTNALGTPIVLFLVSLVYWLIGKSVMKATTPYMKVVEVIGLTFLISSAEVVVTTILMTAMNSIHATPSAAIVLPMFDDANKLHVVLSKLNAFTFWNLSVTGIGLARLFQKDTPKVLVIVFALWILWTAVTILGAAMMGR